jgi:hypothetical protein
MDELRVFSHGGGWQSVATAVLQTQGKLKNPFDVYVFCNVGDKSEPETLAYHRDIFTPFMQAHNIRVVEIDRRKKDGTQYDLYDAVMENKQRTIPVYLANGMPSNRACTSDWKTIPSDKWIKSQGVEFVTVGLGISMDESERAKIEKMQWHTHANGNNQGGRKLGFNKRLEYPLIFDYKIWREDIPAIIESAGLPLPPKSACWFCPFSSRSRWMQLRQSNPERFQMAVDMENTINEKRGNLQGNRVTLHASLRPLADAVGNQPELFDFETGGGCNSGACFT